MLFKIEKDTLFIDWKLKGTIIQEKLVSDTQMFDSLINRIEKNLPNFCPKFLDLYVSLCTNKQFLYL